MKRTNGANPNARYLKNGWQPKTREAHIQHTQNMCLTKVYTFTGFGCLAQWNPDYYT